MYGVCSVPHLSLLAASLRCRQGTLPSSYLVLPLGASYKEMWNSVINCIQRRFVGWKGLYLSEGKKLTLIKLTLASWPTYFLSLL